MKNQTFSRYGDLISRTTLEDLYWNKGETLKGIGGRYGVTYSAVWKWMNELGIERRSSSQVQLHLSSKEPSFSISRLSKNDVLLKRTGLVLYWCEGSHRDGFGKSVNTLAFTNSDEKALRIWMRFLREICHVRKEKIRVHLCLHPAQNKDKLLKYWSGALGVSLRQFEQVSFTKRKKSMRNHASYRGTVRVKVHSQALVNIIRKQLQNLQKLFLK